MIADLVSSMVIAPLHALVGLAALLVQSVQVRNIAVSDPTAVVKSQDRKFPTLESLSTNISNIFCTKWDTKSSRWYIIPPPPIKIEWVLPVSVSTVLMHPKRLQEARQWDTCLNDRDSGSQ